MDTCGTLLNPPEQSSCENPIKRRGFTDASFGTPQSDRLKEQC